MSNPMIVCRNDKTGATAEIPQSALIHMTDWEPIAEGENPPEWTPEERARAIALLEAEKASDDATPEPDPAEASAPAPRTTKGKAVDPAATKEA